MASCRIALAVATLLAPALAQSTAPADPCCDASATRLTYGVRAEATVASGAWTDFYYAAETEGDSLVFEVTATSSSPTALAAYVYDGVVADATRTAEQRCVVCGSGVSATAPAITTVSTFRPQTGMTLANTAAIDMDVVSHIGNSTHRRFFVYVGECYYMRGSVYYLSIYGQSSGTVSFNVETRRVTSALTPGLTSDTSNLVSGSVCDGKYMHYYVDWPVLHPGGMQAVVRKTSGELHSYSVRKDRCAGPASQNIANVNLLGHGCAPRHEHRPPRSRRAA